MSCTSSKPLRLALVDGNNFYVSCERVFNPALIGRPVIVLSNNDGCAVSRSQEAKALGVQMAQPWFQIPASIRRQGLVALSSNYSLYADMSNRMMQVLGQFTPTQEIYSIDESFLDLSHVAAGQVINQAREIRRRVYRWIGIPTCVGIGPTKTLAKLANHVAKKQLSPTAPAGVFAWETLSLRDGDALLQRIPVSEVWGVGRRLSEQLAAQGITTALQLKRASRALLIKRYSVTMGRTVDELNGIPCLPLEEIRGDKQQIMTSRSFAECVTDEEVLKAAIAEFASKSAEKLRKQGCVASGVHVFVRTNRFADDPQYQLAITVPLSVPTDDTLRIIKAAYWGFQQRFIPGYAFKKLGVSLCGIESKQGQQVDLFSTFNQEKSSRLMGVLDQINQKYGSATLKIASATGSYAEGYAMRRERKSQNYTTCWADLPVAQ